MNRRVVFRLYGAAALLCSAAQAQDGGSGLDGVWSSTLTAPNHTGWRIEDHLCGVCTPNEYEHLNRLLADPANDSRGLMELQQEAGAASRQRIERTVTAAARERLAAIRQPNDESETCNPPNLLLAATGPLPISIDVGTDHVTLRNQHWNIVRTIALSEDGPVATGEPSLYGNATARFDGPALVVESVNALPIVTREAVTTERAIVIERYEVAENGSRLDLTIEIRDPDTYTEPRVVYRPRLRTPDVRLVDDDPCANLEN
jgi:hypothetical protein